jgi:PPOX class probable F420-dependent enzyme
MNMTATLTQMQIKHVLRPYIATLATLRKDGSPHTAPVWYRYEGGAFVLLTDEGSQKHKNVMRDPRVELCIDDRERAPFHTVIARGHATVLPHPGPEWRLALAVHYLGEARGRRYVESEGDGGGVMIRINPEKILGW